MSLIELLIVMALLGVLLSLTLPSYQQYVRRSHRTEIVGELAAMAACQERWRAILGHYDTLRCAQQAGSGHYRITYDPANEAGTQAFTLVARPIAGQQRDRCGTLQLDHVGLRSVSGNGDGVSAIECWAGR